MENLNEKIKRLRKQQGITQAEVAKIIGVNQSTYANIEKGETKSITIDIGLGIAKALNTNFIHLFEIPVADYIDMDRRQIERLYQEINELKKQFEQKDILIDLLIADKKSLKQNIIFVLYGQLKNELDLISNNIKECTNENDINQQIREYNKKIFYFEHETKKAYFDIGLLNQKDFDSFPLSVDFKYYPQNAKTL